jgi:hypothetical protein
MKRYIFPDPPEHLDAHCELQPDSMSTPIVGVRDTHPANGAPCISFDVPAGVPNLNGAALRIVKKGYVLSGVLHGLLDTVTPGGGGYECDVFTLVKVGGVRPFKLDGQFPRYSDDGTELLIDSATGFRFFNDFVYAPGRADAFAQSLVDNHFNMVRFAAVQDTTLYLNDPRLRYRIHPADLGEQYYALMDSFLHEYLPSWVLYPDLIGLTQTQTIMPNPDDQVRHTRRLLDLMWDVYGFYSDVNENDVNDNRIDVQVQMLQKPAGAVFLHSSGSNGAGSKLPTMPIRDYVEFHTNDLFEWQRKGKDTMDIANLARAGGFTSESTRTDKDASKAHFEDNAKTEAAMTMGGMFHSPEGKNGDPFDFSLPHLAAHHAGLYDGGVNYRRGQYGRQDCEFLRCYSMTINGQYAWPVRY